MINQPTPEDWYYISNVEEIDSPALVIYPDRIQTNIDTMLDIIGSPGRLRPHVKTHKMAEVVQMQLDAGIWKYKCATIAEAEMLGDLEVQDVLIAYQPVGPKINRILNLTHKFPQTRFSVLIDNLKSANEIASTFERAATSIAVFIDLDVGMHRTGIDPRLAASLFTDCQNINGISPIGIHAYDGHVHHDNRSQREATAEVVNTIIEKLYDEINEKVEVVVSGSPSFPYHAKKKKYTCSPGTSLLWDWRYSQMCEDQNLSHAAIVIARVISKPGNNLLCVDLGHKSIASEMPFPRVHFLNFPAAKQIKHSEEHLVLQVDDNSSVQVGTVLYGIPMHICPTVALHEAAHIVSDQATDTTWQVIARKRMITI